MLIGEITNTIKSPILTKSGKLSKIEELLDTYNAINNEIEKNKIIQFEQSLSETSGNQLFFDALESKMLIQNAIVLWNYLYLSQLLVNNASTKERNRMIASIKRGSIIAWRHINLQGEYDFTKHTANDRLFDLEKIMELGIA